MIKYKNGREAKLDDVIVGLDWRGGAVEGIVVKGDSKQGHPELVFQHAVHKTVCPSLALENFLHEDDAVVNTVGIHTVTAKPASATADA